MKSKTTAAILAFFLGGIGIHRFYLGQGGKGIVYLLFSFTFIPAIISVFDFIIFLTMDEEKFNLKYNHTRVLNIMPDQVVGSSNNIAEELEKLHSLKEKGVLTEDEFQSRKAKLL